MRIKNIKLYHFWIWLKEGFSVFMFYPLLFAGVGIIIAVVFKVFSLGILPPLFIACYCAYSFLWWFMFGRRKPKLHDGDE